MSATSDQPEVLAALAEQVRAQHGPVAPDLRPLRRTLQRLADGLPDNTKALQRRTRGKDPSPAALATRTALDALTWASWMGFDRSLQVQLALAVALRGPLSRGSPTSNIIAVAERRGLGSDAAAVAMLLRDAEAFERGQPRARAGAVVAVLCRFAEEAAGGARHGQILDRWAACPPDWLPPELVEVFVTFKGSFQSGPTSARSRADRS